MEAMSNNQYYQMFEDSYGRIANGAVKDPSTGLPLQQNGGSIYDAGMTAYGGNGAASAPSPAPPPMVPTPPTGAGAWNSYAGSELDFPSPASIGGIATIATAGASSYGRYDGYSDYYGHPGMAPTPGGSAAMTPGAYAGQHSSHSPGAHQAQGWQQTGPTFLQEAMSIKSEAVETSSSAAMSNNDHVTTTSGGWGAGYGSQGMSPGGTAVPPAMSTSPSLSMHSDFDPEQNERVGGGKARGGGGRGGRPSSTTPSSSSGGGGRGKRKGKAADPAAQVQVNPEVKAVKDKERRHSNNTRERIRIKDINEALCELGRVCRSLKTKSVAAAQTSPQDDKPQTKLGILNTAVEVITALEREVRERNLNTSALAVRQAGGGGMGAQPQQPQQGYGQFQPSPSPAQSSGSRPSSGGSSAVNNGIIAN